MIARLHDEDGVTLVELMFAIVILTVVFSAMASALVVSLQSVDRQERRTVAISATNRAVEEVQGMDFLDIALCTATATTYFGGTDFEGEPLVLSAGACGATNEILNPTTVTIDGVDFSIERAVTWTDDPGDDVAGVDPDSDQDIKRITTDVTWTDLSGTQTSRLVAYRADTANERVLSAVVQATSGDPFIDIDDDATTAGENDEQFDLKLFSETRLQSAKVEWVDRLNNPQVVVLTSSNGDLTWSATLVPNFGPFANGNTLFTFTATYPDGTTEEIVSRALFLYALRPLDASLVFSFVELKVGPDGLVCPGQTVQIDIEGVLRSDAVDGTWSKGPATPTAFSSIDAPNEVAVRGSRFLLDLAGRPDFLNVARDTLEKKSRLRIVVTRGVDTMTITIDAGLLDVLEVATCTTTT